MLQLAFVRLQIILWLRNVNSCPPVSLATSSSVLPDRSSLTASPYPIFSLPIGPGATPTLGVAHRPHSLTGRALERFHTVLHCHGSPFFGELRCQVFPVSNLGLWHTPRPLLYV
jgi:hypothetical protein